jgi:hypothetical protein
MLTLWAKFEKGEISAIEARVQIGFARTIIDTLKVEIAAAHLSQPDVPSIPLSSARSIEERPRRLS